MQQQIVLLVGPVHAVRALEAGLFPTFVLNVPLQGALVFVFVPAVHALIQSPLRFNAAQTGRTQRAITQYIRSVQLCN